MCFFFFKHKTAYELRISDWSSDVCSSDLFDHVVNTIGCGGCVATEDAIGLATADGVDVVVELTGSIEYAANVVLAGIAAGKHIVQMNAELDGTLGPILKMKAGRAGVISRFSDGDHPGVPLTLYRFAPGLGVPPRLSGHLTRLPHPPRHPTT